MKSSKDGFTLVELLICLAIVAGVLLYLLMIRGESLKRAFHARQTYQASAKLGEILSRLSAGSAPPPPEEGAVTWRIDKEPLPDSNDLVKVTVILTCATPKGTETLKAQTIVEEKENGEGRE